MNYLFMGSSYKIQIPNALLFAFFFMKTKVYEKYYRKAINPLHIVAALHLHGDVKNIEQLLYLEAIGIDINANTCIAFSPLI